MRIFWAKVKDSLLNNNQVHVNILIIVNLLLAAVAFVKDILLAAYFGTTFYADSLYLAYFLPDTAGNNLLAAAIGISCIPLLTNSLATKGHITKTLNHLLFITFSLSLLLIVFLLPSAKWLFAHINYGIDPNIRDMTYVYFLITLPIVIFSPIAIIGASFLQVSSQFTKPAMMPVILNFILFLVILLCMFINYPLEKGGYLYISTILFATIFVTFLTWWFVLKSTDIPLREIRPFSSFRENFGEVRLFFKILAPYFFILLSQQIIFLVERYIASTLETGTISGLTYAYRLAQFPIWVFIAAVNTVLLPTISKLKDENNSLKLFKELTRSFYIVVFISLVVSVLFFLLGEKLISFLFLQGEFDLHSVRMTNDIFKGYALSILGQSIFLFSIRYFVANGKMFIPLLISVLCSIFHIVLLILLVSHNGSAGIGYAAAVGYTVSGALIIIFLYKDISSLKLKVVNKNG